MTYSPLAASPCRLKVAMVVDNGIFGDSRVIKSAEAVAALGHDVTLFGADLGKEPPVIPGVNVQLLTIQNPGDYVPRMISIENLLRIFVSMCFFASYKSDEKIFAKRSTLVSKREAIKEARGRESIRGIALLLAFYPRFFVHQLRKKLKVLRTKALRKVSYYFAKRRFSREKSRRNRLLSVGSSAPWINFRYEEAFVEAITELEPDVIHTHDYKCVSVGAIAKEQLLKKGLSTFWIYDAHEFLPGLTQYSPEWLELQCQNESTYIKQANCVVTVSSEIADLLVKTHNLTSCPNVILNAPSMLAATNSLRDLRIESNVSDKVLLGLYVGGVTPVRGLDVIIPALEAILELHVTLLTKIDVNVENMQFLAEEIGVGDRLHIVEYVSPNEIVPFISTASFGIAPYLHLLNQEISLPSKFYEYACANLPIVGSDVEVVKSVLGRTNVGEVFEAGNKDSFIEAVLKVSRNLEYYRDNYINSEFMECTWEKQVVVLSNIYQSIGGQAS